MAARPRLEEDADAGWWQQTLPTRTKFLREELADRDFSLPAECCRCHQAGGQSDRACRAGVFLECSGLYERSSGRVFFKDHRKVNNGLHRLFHVLAAYPFEPRMEGVLAGKDVGAG